LIEAVGLLDPVPLGVGSLDKVVDGGLSRMDLMSLAGNTVFSHQSLHHGDFEGIKAKRLAGPRMALASSLVKPREVRTVLYRTFNDITRSLACVIEPLKRRVTMSRPTPIV